MNRSKAKGTNWESNVVKYLRAELDQPEIERRALHGSADMGDVYRIRAHGHDGIAECKDYKTFTDADLARWKSQTLAERENSGAGFAMLVVHRRGKAARADSPTFGQNVVWVTVGDLMRMAGLSQAHPMDAPWEDSEYVWVSVRLSDACALMM